MSGLGGLNKSSNGVVVGLVQLQLPVVETPAQLAAQTQTHLRPGRQGTAQPAARWISSCSPSTRCTGCR